MTVGSRPLLGVRVGLPWLKGASDGTSGVEGGGQKQDREQPLCVCVTQIVSLSIYVNAVGQASLSPCYK